MNMEDVKKLLDICSALERDMERDRSTWERVVSKVMPHLVKAARHQETTMKGKK